MIKSKRQLTSWFNPASYSSLVSPIHRTAFNPSFNIYDLKTTYIFSRRKFKMIAYQQAGINIYCTNSKIKKIMEKDFFFEK